MAAGLGKACGSSRALRAERRGWRDQVGNKTVQSKEDDGRGLLSGSILLCASLGYNRSCPANIYPLPPSTLCCSSCQWRHFNNGSLRVAGRMKIENYN